MSTVTWTHYHVWLAQSPPSEFCWRTSCSLPVVPGQMFASIALWACQVVEIQSLSVTDRHADFSIHGGPTRSGLFTSSSDLGKWSPLRPQVAQTQIGQVVRASGPPTPEEEGIPVSGDALEDDSPHWEVVETDACLTGWGAVWQGRTARGQWDAQQRLEHINVLELRAVLLALRLFLPVLRDWHVLVGKDNTSTVYQINHQGGTRLKKCPR